MNNKWRFLEFNLGFVCISSSAVLGRFMTTSSAVVTFGRCAIAAMFLLLLGLVLKRSLSFDWKNHGWIMIGTSFLMAIHWTAYFYSLDYSNVAVALMTLYTFPAITAIIEPVWHNQRIPRKNIILALLALVAIAIIASPGKTSGKLNFAIALGVFSALCYSIRNVWITSISSQYKGTTLMTYQLAWMAFILCPSLFFVSFDVAKVEWGALLFLGLVTTAIGHTLFMRGLTYYKATTASILACIIPIYGVGLGYFLLGETPSVGTYIGGSIIIGIVLYTATDKSPDYSSS